MQEREDAPGGLSARMRRLAKPVAKKLLYRAVAPGPALRRVWSAAADAQYLGRELYEWARRSLVATPMFLSKCAVHGDDIAVDRMPYMNGDLRIELGSRIRISGLIGIRGASVRGRPLLRIGSGVFIAHDCSFNVADRIEVGDYASIGMGTYLADTEGHNHYNPQRPIWEVPPGEGDIAPVVIEDNVQIGRQCMILKGVRIGARSVIGARTVVRTDIPPDSIVMGNPGRVVKRMTPPEAAVANGAAAGGDDGPASRRAAS